MTCDDFLQDPEACRTHADECESCRRLQMDLDMLEVGLDAPLLERSIADKLPLAPWEGAGHRPWGAVVSVALVLIALASGLFLMIGESPLSGFGAAAKSAMFSALPLRVIVVAGSRIREAPISFQAGIAVGFLLVNVLLYVLMKRPGRGYDAS